MYQPAGSGTAWSSVNAPVLLTAADAPGVPSVVKVELSGEIAITQVAIVFVPAMTTSTATVICRATGLTFAVPETQAPVFGSVPAVIGGAFGTGCAVAVNSISPDRRTVPSAFSMFAR